MELSKNLSSHQALTTPPDSPTGTATSQAIVKDLKHLFGVFLEKVLHLTDQQPPNTPVSKDKSPLSPDVVGQLLECASAELASATEPAQSCSASNEQEEAVQVAEGIDIKHTICTTPDDFKLFKKWASSPSFKTVVETYEPPANLPF